jgi:hypothetical protein
MGVLALVLIFVVVFVQAQDKPAQDVAAVDFAPTLQSFRADTPFPVYAPSPVPAGWIPNHARAVVKDADDPAYLWDLGFYVPATKEYAAVEQSDASGWLDTQLGATPKQDGTTLVDGVSWQTWTDSTGRPALVRDVTGSTLIVDGKASLATLERLAGALTT